MQMASAGNGPDPLRPQRPVGLGRGAMLALVVHLGLLLALALGVSWRASVIQRPPNIRWKKFGFSTGCAGRTGMGRVRTT